jgi:hypothetical protein
MTVAAEVVLASTRQDADAVETVRRHHAELAGGLTARLQGLLAAAETPGGEAVEATRADLVSFCRRELIPHAKPKRPPSTGPPPACGPQQPAAPRQHSSSLTWPQRTTSSCPAWSPPRTSRWPTCCGLCTTTSPPGRRPSTWTPSGKTGRPGARRIGPHRTTAAAAAAPTSTAGAGRAGHPARHPPRQRLRCLRRDPGRRLARPGRPARPGLCSTGWPSVLQGGSTSPTSSADHRSGA